MLSVGIGLASGIGAVELALVMSLAFNYCFLALWISEYGEREGMKRYMSDFNPNKRAGERSRSRRCRRQSSARVDAAALAAHAVLEDLGADRIVGRDFVEEAAEVGQRLAPGPLVQPGTARIDGLHRRPLGAEFRRRGDEQLIIVPAIALILALARRCGL